VKKVFKPSDFDYFTSSTDRIVAATVAQEKFESILQSLLKDPTKQATGEFAQGYRSCLRDLMSELESK
jgi:hypothetical protein